MSISARFVTSLICTVLLLFAVLSTGRAGRRRTHIALVASMLVSLTVTILFAIKLGTLYDLESAGWITPLHLTLAKICVVAYLAPLTTGWITYRGNEKMRGLHARVAYAVFALTVITLFTGVAMILMSERVD